MVAPVMFVSKQQEVPADFYIESEADEIYVPDGAGVTEDYGYGRHGKYRQKFGSKGPKNQGIVGYQKYLHLVSQSV